MIRAILISAFLFTIGNIVWPYFKEPKIFYVPLAVTLLLLFTNLKKNNKDKITGYLIDYFILLSYGNLVKQIFYSERLKQINDYIWGSMVTIALLIVIAWEIRKQRYGTN